MKLLFDNNLSHKLVERLADLFPDSSHVMIEGLVHVTALTDDYYHFDPVGRRLHGEYSGKVYRLSDSVRVKVTRVDVEEKKVDFELA